MKRVLILTWLICFAGFFTLEAQDKDQVVHLKKYDFGGSSSNYYLSADEGEEEVVVKKTTSPYNDETFTLEYVSGEKYQLYCHIKTFNNQYVVVEDGSMVLVDEKPDKTFMILWEGDDDNKVSYYRMWFNSEVGIAINSDGELQADGSSTSFFMFEEVKEGAELSNSLLERPRNYSFRLRVFTSNGVFTETSSNIGIRVYYSFAYSSTGSTTTTSKTVSSDKIGRVGNREATTYFDFSHYSFGLDKVVVTNNGGGVNETWKVDWATLEIYRNHRWEQVETTLMGYWINKGESFTINP